LRKIEVGPYPTGFRGLALAPDGQRLIVGNEGGSMVRVIELPNGKESHRFALAAPPRGLSFSGDGRLAVSGSWSGHVYLWRVPGIFED
jgi:WD40 repeat protein